MTKNHYWPTSGLHACADHIALPAEGIKIQNDGRKEKSVEDTGDVFKRHDTGTKERPFNDRKFL